MSTFSSLADNEMLYYQYKARQKRLLEIENYEWREFLKKNPCECPECRDRNVKETKDVSVQVPLKTSVLNFNTNQRNQRNSNQRDATAVSLKGIESKLQNIETTLLQTSNPSLNMHNGVPRKIPPVNRRKMHDSHEPSSSDFNKITSNTYYPVLNSIDSDIDRLRQVLKNKLSLRSHSDISSKKLPSSSDNKINADNPKQKSVTDKRLQSLQTLLEYCIERVQLPTQKDRTTFPAMKKSGFIIPHNLQKKRTVSRKAYLDSLSKPKVTTSALNAKAEKICKNKSKENINKDKTIHWKSQDSTKKCNSELTEPKDSALAVPSNSDENIENVIDAIINELICEASVDAYRTKLRKQSAMTLIKEPVSYNGNVSEKSKTESEIPHNVHKTEEDVSKPVSPQKNQVAFSGIEDDPRTLVEDTANTNSEVTHLSTEIKSTELSIDHKAQREVRNYRKEFRKYLERNECPAKGNFNPCVLVDMVADSLLDECLESISEELLNVSSSLVDDLLKKEYMESI